MYIKIPTELNQYMDRPGLVLFYSCMASMAEGKPVANISVSNEWFEKHLGLSNYSVHEYGVILENMGLLNRNKAKYGWNEDGYWAKRDWTVKATLYNELMSQSTLKNHLLQYRLNGLSNID